MILDFRHFRTFSYERRFTLDWTLDIIKMFAKSITNLLVRNTSTVKNSQILRSFSVTSVNGEIVKIQSTDDFKEKVINSKVPVVVDFFAT